MTFHTPHGRTDNKPNFIGLISAGRLKYDTATPEETVVRVNGQTAIATGKVDIQYQWQGTPYLEHLYYTAVYDRPLRAGACSRGNPPTGTATLRNP